MTDTDAQPHAMPFLDHPETAEAGRRILEAVQREGDRGAMLVAGEMLSGFLRDALKTIRPEAVPKKDLSSLFGGSGPLGSWATRSRVAALIGLITPRTLQALEDLREVRNKAAHSEESFSLEMSAVRLRRAFDLGPGTMVAINRMALETVISDALNTMSDRGAKLVEEIGRNPFEDPQEVLRMISEDPQIMATLGNRTWRLELGVGVWLLLGLMRLERDAFMARVNPDVAGAASGDDRPG